MKIVLEPLEPLQIDLPDIGSFLIDAPTRAQVERVIALRHDTENGEFSLAEIDRRRRTELRLLIEPAHRAWYDRVPAWGRWLLRRLCRIGEARLPIERMHPGQVSETLTALINHYFGNDAAGAVALERGKKKALARTMRDWLTSGATTEPSASTSGSVPPKSDNSPSQPA